MLYKVLLDGAVSDDEADDEGNRFSMYDEEDWRRFESRFSARTRPTTYKSKATTDTYKSLQVCTGCRLFTSSRRVLVIHEFNTLKII